MSTRVSTHGGHPEPAADPVPVVRRASGNPMVPRLLTVEEVRAELGIGSTLIRGVIASGALPVVRIGRAVRVRRVDLDAYVEAHLSGRAR